MLRLMTFDKWSEVLGLSDSEVDSAQTTTSSAGKRPRTTSDDEPTGNYYTWSSST